MPDWIRRPTLGLSLVAIVMLVLGPTLAIVGIDLWRATQSYRESSSRQMLETARVVSRSVEGELASVGGLLRNFTLLREPGEDGRNTARRFAVGLLGGQFAIDTVDSRWADQQVASGRYGPDAIATITDVAERGGVGFSNLISALGHNGRIQHQIVVAARDSTGAEGSLVASIITSPAKLIRALENADNPEEAMVLAVIDGTGRIIARSRDGETFLGRPVPDWHKLAAMPEMSGLFEAITLEGGGIKFAFHRIAGTPGWVAVAGEPLAVYQKRWQQPLLVMLSAAAGTVAVAGILAMMLARRVLQPVRQLARRAQAVAEKRSDCGGEVQPSFVREFELLRNSLNRADEEMRRSLDESQQAERAALESNTALRLAERIARMGSWTLDPDRGDFIGSAMLHELMGLDVQGRALVLEDLEELMADDSFVLLSRAVAHCVQTDTPFGFELEFFRHDGTSFYGFIQGQAMHDARGKICRISGTVQDITERKEHSERMAALADNLPSGVIYRMEQELGGGIRISYISAGLERLTGIPAAAAVAESSALIGAILPTDRLAMMEKLDHSAESGEIFDQEFRLKSAEGRQIWMHARAAARRLPNGRMVWDGILRDISSEREVGDALRRAKESAEKAEKAKSDFLAAMSHEIRTPMNSVVGMTRLALQTNLDTRQRNYLEKIDISAQSLLGIINDILDFSKIEAGGMELEQTTFELEQVLKSVSTVIALRAEEKDLEVAYAIAPDTPPLLVGDPLRLGQVLTNLLGNAVKFTPQGEIVVAIRPAAPSAKGRPMMQFSVRDSGIGMNDEQLRNLFKPFTQASIDTSRKYGGTGLGLAICKRLVELMGGKIWAESTAGQGTTFHFTAELEVAEDDGSLATLRRPSAYLRGRRVLIVDDNASARQVLSDMTRDFGMETLIASGGEEALAILRQEAEEGRRFDLVLVDWRMPGMDGMETARHIKQDETHLKLPSVLMVTAFNYDAVLEAAGEIGIKGVLIKPVTQSVLFNTVLGILSIDGVPMAKTRAAEVGGAHRIEDFRVLAGRRALVVDDNAFNREVASDFLHLVGIEAETAINGREAITLMESRHYDVVLMDMHMPVMDGLSAVREIRQNPAWYDLPVVALTAQARVEDHLASHEAGMTAHLSKPIDEFALYGTLVKVLGLDVTPQSDVAYDPASTPEPVMPASFVLDLTQLTQRFGGNQDRVLRMLRGFQRDFSGLTEQLEMQLVAGDLPALADIAHQVKGAAGYFGAEACVEAAAAQERLARAGEEAALAEAAHLFVAQLEEVLEAIASLFAAQDAQEQAEIPVASAEGGAGDLLALIDRAAPLVRAGDFAARSILEDLATGLRGGELAAVIEVVLDLFDDLELDEAAAALTDLRAELTGAMEMGSA